MKSFIEDLSSYVLALHAPNRFPLSAPLRWVFLTNGDVDFIDNVILFGFEEKKTKPTFVAKVPRLVGNGPMLQVEYDRLVELWDCVGADAALYLPQPIAMTTLQKQPVLILSYLSGESLARASRSAFWGNEKKVLALAVDAARALRSLNDRTATRILTGENLLADFRRKTDKFKELFSVTEQESKVLSSLAETVNDASALATHKVLIQGDFWHGNMIRGAESGRLMFVDWQFAHWSVDVSMDVYLFLLVGALAAAPYGTTEIRVQGAMQILSQWRSKIIPAYLSAYGMPENYILLPVREGAIACCVEKAVRSVLDFGYIHSDDLMWRQLFTKLIDWPEEN